MNYKKCFVFAMSVAVGYFQICTCLPALALTEAVAEKLMQSGVSDHHNWQHFNPYKFQPANRLVPTPSAMPIQANFYSHGAPPFPHDPSKSNIIYGRGPKSMPTEIYAKAYDILQIGNKYFQAPAAGESKVVQIGSESVVLYGTTCYTPLPDNRFVGNPAQISPFDPTRIFYKDKVMWPSVIYGEPGQQITIANQQVTIPGPGQTAVIIIGADGKIKSDQDSHDKSANAREPEKHGTTGGNQSSDSKTGSSTGSSSGSATSGNHEGSGVRTPASALAAQTAEKAAAAKVAAEKAAAEKAATEKAAAEKAAAEKAAAEKAATEKAAAEKAAAEKAAAEKAAAENAAALASATSRSGNATESSGSSSGAGSSGSSSGTGSSGSSSGTGSSGSGSGTGSSGSSSGTGSSGSGSGTGNSGSGFGTGSLGTGVGGSGSDGGQTTTAYSTDAAVIPVTTQSSVKDDPGFFGLGAKQEFSIPISRKAICFYYDSNHMPASTQDVTGTVTGDINVLNQTVPIIGMSSISAVCELGTTAGPTALYKARTLQIPEFKRSNDKSTAYPRLGPVIIAFRGNGTTHWTDSNSFKIAHPDLFAAPDSGVRYQQAGGPVGSAGGDSMLGSYADPNSGTQLKSANEQAFDLSKVILKIIGQ